LSIHGTTGNLFEADDLVGEALTVGMKRIAWLHDQPNTEEICSS